VAGRRRLAILRADADTIAAAFLERGHYDLAQICRGGQLVAEHHRPSST
jgi:hypothetical protein